MAYSNDYIGDTGQGAVIVIVDNSDTSIEPCMGCPRSIQLPELTMEAIDTTCLDDTGFMRRIPADVSDPGVIEATFIYDAAKAGPTQLFVDGQQLLVTITFPRSRSTTTAPATLIATGFVSSLGLPSMETSTLMELTLSIQLDGFAGPTLTIENPEVTCVTP